MNKKTRDRILVQMSYLKMFARARGLDYRDNSTIQQWIDDGYADRFARMYDKQA